MVSLPKFFAATWALVSLLPIHAPVDAGAAA